MTKKPIVQMWEKLGLLPPQLSDQPERNVAATPDSRPSTGYADARDAEEEYLLRLEDYRRTRNFRDKQAAVAALKAWEDALSGHNPHTDRTHSSLPPTER